MDLIEVFEKFPTQEACIAHLEKYRWPETPTCPHCHSDHVARKAEKGRIGRWNCHACHSSYNVLSGTIFEKTKVDLRKWFLAINLMLNAKKSLSSYQLARDIKTTHPTALYMQHRIRAAMADHDTILQGILEADETYVGGKPRRTNKKDDHTPNKPGRGTKKTPVIGVVERGGSVVAKVATDLTGKGIVKFLKKHISLPESLLVTDEYPGYHAVDSLMAHEVINHSEQYAVGDIHSNTIEGFWALIKRAWYGSHHHYSKKNMPLFIAETSWKYNERKNPRMFDTFLRGVFA
jgi:transposase-like protein